MGISGFIATNIDDLFVLMLFFSSTIYHKWQVVVGKYLVLVHAKYNSPFEVVYLFTIFMILTAVLVHCRLLPSQTSTDCFQNALCRSYYFSIRSHRNRNLYYIGILCIWFSVLENSIELQRILEYFYQYILNIESEF